jgi:hypothetical protein
VWNNFFLDFNFHLIFPLLSFNFYCSIQLKVNIIHFCQKSNFSRFKEYFGTFFYLSSLWCYTWVEIRRHKDRLLLCVPGIYKNYTWKLFWISNASSYALLTFSGRIFRQIKLQVQFFSEHFGVFYVQKWNAKNDICQSW